MISYRYVLCKGKMKCNCLGSQQGKFALGKLAHCEGSFTLEQTLLCNQSHKILVSCEESCRQTPAEDSHSGLDLAASHRVGFGGPWLLPGQPCHDARMVLVIRNMHYFQSQRFGSSQWPLCSPHLQHPPRAVQHRAGYLGHRAGTKLPPPPLWTLCGCVAHYLRACALSLHVTEASAQAGQTYGWLPFVSRNYLRDVLA